MNCLDAKDWEGLESILSDNVECDYSALRGNKEIISRDEFISKRMEALNPLNTHHLISNHEVIFNGKKAKCKASAVIWRRNADKEFNTHAIYNFQLEKKGDRWIIFAIKQEVLWNDGDPSIHAGAKDN